MGVALSRIGWLLIQVSSTVAPQLNLPEGPRLVTFVILLGFDRVGAGVGFRRYPKASAHKAPVGNKRVIAVAAILVALAFGWYWKTRPAPVSAVADARSIAVLPFVNMSDDKGNDYFSDGISEEILNVLARMSDLHVAARTSSFSFRKQEKEIPTIAQELKVRMVLEGSVRKQGERVRVTAQLIDASNGFHVWSQTFDRDLKDIFAIQDEIANAIANELQLKLETARPNGAGVADTADMAAYDSYLKGMALWQARGGKNLHDATICSASLWRKIRTTPRPGPGWLLCDPAGMGGSDALAQTSPLARDAAEHALASTAICLSPTPCSVIWRRRISFRHRARCSNARCAGAILCDGLSVVR